MDDDWKVIIFFIIILMAFLFGNIYQFLQSQKEIIIEGEVIDVDISPDRYMIVTFDNGDVYHISTWGYEDEKVIDFTVNSKMVIKLKFSSWWLMPNSNNVWSIYQLVKVPGDE